MPRRPPVHCPTCGRAHRSGVRCPSLPKITRGRGRPWRRIRERLIDDNPYCQRCGARPSQIAHHVTPVAEGGSDEPDNLLAVCEPCHEALHEKAEGASAKVPAFPRIAPTRLLCSSSKPRDPGTT